MRPAKSFFRLFVLCTLGLMLLWAPSHAQQLVGKSFMVRVDSKAEQATVKFASAVEQIEVAYAEVLWGEGQPPKAKFLAIFEGRETKVPKCRVTEGFLFNGWRVEKFEVRKSQKTGYFVFIFGKGGEGGGYAEELFVGHLTSACDLTKLIERQASHSCNRDRSRGNPPSGGWYLICNGAMLSYEIDPGGNLLVHSTLVEREALSTNICRDVECERRRGVKPSKKVKTEKIDLERVLSSRTPPK